MVRKWKSKSDSKPDSKEKTTYSTGDTREAGILPLNYSRPAGVQHRKSVSPRSSHPLAGLRSRGVVHLQLRTQTYAHRFIARQFSLNPVQQNLRRPVADVVRRLHDRSHR